MSELFRVTVAVVAATPSSSVTDESRMDTVSVSTSKVVVRTVWAATESNASSEPAVSISTVMLVTWSPSRIVSSTPVTVAV